MSILQEIKNKIDADKKIFKNRYWMLTLGEGGTSIKILPIGHISCDTVVFMNDKLAYSDDDYKKSDMFLFSQHKAYVNPYLLMLKDKYPITLYFDSDEYRIEIDKKRLRKYKIDNLLSI